MSSKLSPQEVAHIAELAKLGLSAEEAELFREQLSEILSYAEKLQALDTEGVPPMAHVGELGNVMRDDQVTPSLSQEEAVENAPDREDGYFKIKPIFES